MLNISVCTVNDLKWNKTKEFIFINNPFPVVVICYIVVHSPDFFFFLLLMKSYNENLFVNTVSHTDIYLCNFFCPVCVLPDQNDTVLVFRGSAYWTVSAEGSVTGPLSLRQRWSDIPTPIEAAAFSPLDSKWYFFKGAASLNSLTSF